MDHVPSTGADPVSSLGPEPITVTEAGATFIIPAQPAAPWLKVLLSENPDLMAIWPGMGGDEAEAWVQDRLWSGELSVDDYNTTLQDILTMASGHPWWFTIRLCVLVKNSWDYIGGELALRNIDPQKVCLAVWVDAAYFILRKFLPLGDKEKGQQAMALLNELLQPPDYLVVEQFDEEAEAAAFMQVMKGM